MNAFAFAWRSLVRQPARALLGILGVAAVGALLFDMLLLSRGLVLSMRDLLDRGGFDVRVMATDSLPGSGPRIRHATATAAALTALPEVDETVALRLGEAEIDRPNHRPVSVSFFGAHGSRRRAWVVVEGRDLSDRGGRTGEVLVNRNVADLLGRRLGGTVMVRAACSAGRSVPPPMTFGIVGIAEFPFDDAAQMTVATTLNDALHACGDRDADDADLMLVMSSEDADAENARLAIRRLRPDLHALTNEQVVAGFQESEFSYFRQISTVLVAVTLAFGFLLITVLLTVSVNQRLGTIAALRALGFSRRRVVADVMCESALIVGIGGALALPLGLAQARWLDWILKALPGVPSELHFFVFQPRALLVHVALLAVTAVLAALYPMRIVARLPIAATLRNEVIS